MRLAHHFRAVDRAASAAFASAQSQAQGQAQTDCTDASAASSGAAAPALFAAPPLDLAGCAEGLTRLALRLGSPDNITVIVVELEYD